MLTDGDGTPEDLKLQLALDKIQRVAWIESLCDWKVIGTFTFAWESSLSSTQRIFERWMRRKVGRVSYYYAIERNPSRDGCHVHSIWGDCRNVFRKDAWADWFAHYGRAKIEPVRTKRDVTDYCSKYLCKADCWWNVKLQWHRIEQLHNRKFKLT